MSKGYLVKVGEFWATDALDCGSELDQVFAAKPGVLVTDLSSSTDEELLEFVLERAPLRSERERD